MRRPACLLLLLTTLALPACGGGDDDDAGAGPGGSAEARKGAETIVREYLAALLDKRGADACAKFTPEYQRSVVRQNRDFAAKENVRDCAGLIDEITRASAPPTFEGQRLSKGTIGKLKLVTTVRQSGEEHNATVTGSRGVQRYELETRDGRWLITKIERTR